MKKSKIFVVIALAVVLCIVSVTSTTFSWFTRPKTYTGNGLLIPQAKYDISNGNNVDFVTYESTNGGKTYGTTPITNFDATIHAGERKMYRTDIVNTSNQTQSVSLFLNTLSITSSNQDLFIGVNSPLKTFKPFGTAVNQGYTDSWGTKAMNPADTMRIYFQPKCSAVNVNNGWKGEKYEVHYGSSSDKMTETAVFNGTSNGSGDDTTYFADIKSSAKSLYIQVQGKNNNWARTQTFTDIVGDGQSKTNSLVFWLTGNYESGSDYAIADKSSVIGGANIINYYPSITMRKGATFDASLTKGVDCIYSNNEIYYYRDDESTVNFSVNKTSGLITATSVGTGIYHTKVKGVFNKSDGYTDDAMQLDTTVNVIDVAPSGKNTYTMAPVVTNIKLEAHKEGDDAAVESVYWYIKNSGSGDMKYTVSSLDLTL